MEEGRRSRVVEKPCHYLLGGGRSGGEGLEGTD